MRLHTQGPSNSRAASKQQGEGLNYSMASPVGTASPESSTANLSWHAPTRRIYQEVAPT
jgi:hypothetical protein